MEIATTQVQCHQAGKKATTPANQQDQQQAEQKGFATFGFLAGKRHNHHNQIDEALDGHADKHGDEHAAVRRILAGLGTANSGAKQCISNENQKVNSCNSTE